MCGASLRKSRKISHRHAYACAHGVGTPIARAELRSYHDSEFEASQIASIIAIVPDQ